MDNIKQSIPLHVVSDSSVSSFNTIAEVHDFSLNANVDVLDSLHDPVLLSTCNSNQHININDVLWHHRRGHVPFAQMKNIPSISSSLSARNLGTLPHSIIFWGKIFSESVDDYSMATWTHLLHSKSYAFTLIKALIAIVKAQFQLPIKVIRSDNSLDLGSSNLALKFFSDTRIIHETTCPHTPQQNGVVERKHKHLLETSRALLFQSKLPTNFWGDCVLTATYLINRFPSSILCNKTPFEVLYGCPPSYSHLKPFGCLCYATVPKCHRDKFQPRAFPYIFFGYPYAKKGYKIFNLYTKSVLISRDIIFHESMFPYQLVQSTPSSSTPSFSFPMFSFDTHFDLSSSTPPESSSPDIPIPIASHVPDHSLSDSIQPSSPIHIADPSQSGPQTRPTPVIRKSSTTHQIPSHLRDYFVQLPSSLSSSTPSSISATYHALVEPHSYTHVAARPAWQEVMAKEFEALEANKTWKIVKLPIGKIKYKADDVSNAFLHGYLDEEVYMKIPPRISVPSTSSNSATLKKFITDLLDEYHCSDVSEVVAPLDNSHTLHADLGDLLPQPDKYMSLVGKLHYLTHTRPDMCFTLQDLSQFLQALRIPHMTIALYVLRYLKGTLDSWYFYYVFDRFAAWHLIKQVGSVPTLQLEGGCWSYAAYLGCS
ncbi:uncharacterized protein LOC142173363 [Nicotiana tabacum]|uniref:Uncharacterized protein LOC142173363 n=1 Tax=Nicotiana tabacum TaxID=4097 RepID=A0AC58TCV2_TOBAC